LVRHARAVLVNRWRQQNHAIRDLLDRYRREEERLKRRRGVMTFADLTAALTGAESIGTLDEIAFRLDARLHHVLLDEFQDTSLMQWRALEPLVREIASVAPPERSFFCVGDAKQSIYVWRDAAPELHAALPSLLPGLAEVELSENRRSAPAIIEAVNAVFEPLSSNPALEDCRGAAADFLESFAPHTHLDENRGLAGRVEVRVVPRAAAVAQQRLTRLRAAAELVADLHRAHPHLSIGILVRTNPTVARMLHELGPGRCNTPASGRGGGPLIDAPAVNAILDLLRLADHPDDTVAAFHVAASPLGAVVGLGAFDDRAAREHVARHVRRAVLRDGLAATVARWVQALAGACEARELRRALQLVELAGPFEARRSLRSGDFAALVEQTAVADAFPAPVMVMTIHQAKGLEFDVVILPELDFKLAGQPPNVVVDRDSPIGPITRLARFAHKEIRALVPELEPMFARERVRAVRESLSLLYVAMTRAKRCLVMMIDPPKSNEQSISKQADGLLRHALVGQAAEPGSIAYECGSRDWAASIEPRDTAAVPIVAAVRPIELAASTARQRRLARAAAGADPIAPSRGAGDDAPAGADPIAPSRGAGDDAPAGRSDAAAPWDDEARDRGLALHALCEQVAWLEDGLPSEATLAAAVREAAPRRDEPWRHAVLRHFARMLRRPEIVRWFHRGERLSASLDLRREQPFARLEGDVIQSGRIDRLVGERSGRDGTGPVDRATVIDFKTDAIDRADAPASADRYRPQLEVYRRAAAELFSLDESAVDVVILFLDAGVGVPIARRSAPQASDPID
jgi:ATP-dependent exoDNAse (exonuclease V) beta subunit